MGELYASCTRFLNGHGARQPDRVLSDIVDELGDFHIDTYGDGGVVADLEAEACELLGKPAAVFMPSGTMAQQIAMRIHADRTGRDVLLWHPTCHLALHEGEGVVRLHRLQPRPVGNTHRLITMADLEEVAEYAAVLLLELPQREIGGQLPEWDDLVAQTGLARSHGTATHLDGARLLESLPFYQRTAAEVAALFDSVYLSLYKGIGGLAGCVLAGDEQLVVEAREWRRRHGGTLFRLWPYAAAGLAALRRRGPRIPRYVEHARAIAAELATLEEVTVVPDPPVTNMAHLHIETEGEAFKAAARSLAIEDKIWTWGYAQPTALPDRVAVELVVGDATLDWPPEEVRGMLALLIERALSRPDD
jgi:threonine aldolase